MTRLGPPECEEPAVFPAPAQKQELRLIESRIACIPTMNNTYHVGQHVYFGRPNGQKTLGEVVKVNPTRLKVRTLEARGAKTTDGTIWNVPPNLCTPADGGRPAQVTQVVAPVALPSYAGLTENQLMDKIRGIYSQLSPENLSCDGELSRTQVQKRYTNLKRELRACFIALGREVSESQAYAA